MRPTQLNPKISCRIGVVPIIHSASSASVGDNLLSAQTLNQVIPGFSSGATMRLTCLGFSEMSRLGQSLHFPFEISLGKSSSADSCRLSVMNIC